MHMRYLALVTISPSGVAPQWTVGDRLRKARELTGLDQAAFADEIGVSRNTVSKYERSDKPPRPIVLRVWAVRCGVSREWLVSGIEPPTPPPGPGLNSGWNSTPKANTRRLNDLGRRVMPQRVA